MIVVLFCIVFVLHDSSKLIYPWDIWPVWIIAVTSLYVVFALLQLHFHPVFILHHQYLDWYLVIHLQHCI